MLMSVFGAIILQCLIVVIGAYQEFLTCGTKFFSPIFFRRVELPTFKLTLGRQKFLFIISTFFFSFILKCQYFGVNCFLFLLFISSLAQVWLQHCEAIISNQQIWPLHVLQLKGYMRVKLPYAITCTWYIFFVSQCIQTEFSDKTDLLCTCNR